MPVDVVRDTAVLVLRRVAEKGAFLSVALDKSLGRRQIAERGRRFLTQLVYGTVRNQGLCDYVLAGVLRQPLDDLPPAIAAILRMGVFQILFCNQVTLPAMVHTSVDLAKRHGHAGTAKLVNAVLKRVPQTLEEVVFPSREDAPTDYLSVRYSLPAWLTARWLDELGYEEAEALCAALCEQAPVTLRANLLRTSVERLLEGFEKTGYDATKTTEVPEEVTVIGGAPPSRSKLFQQGSCMLQDPASMLAPHLLDPRPGELILDMCAAPGGKCTHIAELAQGEARVVAMDIHTGKLRQVRENITRLETPGVLLCAGDGDHAPFAGGFDRVLLDAPCSGLGTLRRHPEIRTRIHEDNLASCADRQVRLLRSAVDLCKNDGIIIYSVCTPMREETTGVLARVLETCPLTTEDGPDWFTPWRIARGQYRTMPHLHGGLDGFYLTRLRKRS